MSSSSGTSARSKKKKSSNMVKLIDDAIEHGATDEAKKKKKDSSSKSANSNWMTFDNFSQENDKQIKRASNHKRGIKEQEAPSKEETKRKLRKEQAREEAKRMVDERWKDRRNQQKKEEAEEEEKKRKKQQQLQLKEKRRKEKEQEMKRKQEEAEEEEKKRKKQQQLQLEEKRMKEKEIENKRKQEEEEQEREWERLEKVEVQKREHERKKQLKEYRRKGKEIKRKQEEEEEQERKRLQEVEVQKQEHERKKQLKEKRRKEKEKENKRKQEEKEQELKRLEEVEVQKKEQERKKQLKEERKKEKEKEMKRKMEEEEQEQKRLKEVEIQKKEQERKKQLEEKQRREKEKENKRKKEEEQELKRLEEVEIQKKEQERKKQLGEKQRREKEKENKRKQEEKEQELKRLEEVEIQKKKQERKKQLEEKQRTEKEKEMKRKMEEEQERKKQLEESRKSDNSNTVERVPKRSALLAMGGPEAEEYKRKLALDALATWTNNTDRWTILDDTFDGVSSSETKEEVKIFVPSIAEGITNFKKNPEKYITMHFPAQLTDEDLQQYPFTYILRAGTTSYHPKDVRPDGGNFIIYQHIFKRLEPLKDNILPMKYCDQYTDSMTFQGKKLHSDKKNLPLLPGRGMGLVDTANLKLIGEYADPSDVFQGSIGDCWLLSAIACLADFDWAVKRLFRKTKKPMLVERPIDQPNQYIVTLWDLPTWTEVDIIVDERLPVRSNNSGFLLGAKPSKDGKLWVPYLEKAIAIHCGGYDKVVGGNCANAWPMLTGSRNQYFISLNPKTKKYLCTAKYNPYEEKWAKHFNSPHDDNDSRTWSVEWPKVGGGGDRDTEITANELFCKLVKWDETNYLIGAGTAGTSDKNSTNGIVDNHAYSVIDSRQNVCGTGVDLLLVRNPWGEGGGIKNGDFMTNGPGWRRYPQIKTELNPGNEDYGIFWFTKAEFFRYFPSMYLCKFNMTRLKDDEYVNDLKDEFKRLGSKAPKPPKKPKSLPVQEDELQPIYINKESDPNSPYKIIEQTMDGSVSYIKINKDVIKGKSVAKGVEYFKKNPEKILAIHYQKNIVEEGWPVHVHQYTLIYRKGTEGINIQNGSKRTILTNILR